MWTSFVVIVSASAAVVANLPRFTFPKNLPSLAIRPWLYNRLRSLTASQRVHLQHAVVAVRAQRRFPGNRLIIEYHRVISCSQDAAGNVRIESEYAYSQLLEDSAIRYPAIIWYPTSVRNEFNLQTPPPSPLQVPQPFTLDFPPQPEPDPDFEAPPSPLFA